LSVTLALVAAVNRRWALGWYCQWCSLWKWFSLPLVGSVKQTRNNCKRGSTPRLRTFV